MNTRTKIFAWTTGILVLCTMYLAGNSTQHAPTDAQLPVYTDKNTPADTALQCLVMILSAEGTATANNDIITLRRLTIPKARAEAEAKRFGTGEGWEIRAATRYLRDNPDTLAKLPFKCAALYG